MPDNSNWRLYVLKARWTLVKLWLCLLLVCEKDKATSQKDLVLHSKVAMKGLRREMKCLQHNTVGMSLGISIPDRWMDDG